PQADTETWKPLARAISSTCNTVYALDDAGASLLAKQDHSPASQLPRARPLLSRPAAIHVPGGAPDLGGGFAAEEQGELAAFLGGDEVQRGLLFRQQVVARLFRAGAGTDTRVDLLLDQRR